MEPVAAPPVHSLRTSCRGCGGTHLAQFLSLGPTPLANSFLRDPDEFTTEASFPLDVYFCAHCTLVQLLDVIDPEVLFRDYVYVTGTSETMAAHNRAYAATIAEMLSLGAGDLVIEIASNDGSLLRNFGQFGVRMLGVEPATNIAQLARATGVETINEFFNSAAALEIRRDYGAARVVIANNVLAHVDDTRDFLRGCKDLLADDGLLVVEVPYVRELLDRLEYDTVYHEHLCYFSVTALMHLCEAVGLSIVRIDEVAVHGGSLRVYAGRVETHLGHGSDVVAMANREAADGLSSLPRYVELARQVAANRVALRGLLQTLRREGKSIAGYGAPAKGNTLLNFCGIGPELVSYTVDRNSLKVGAYTPGRHIPVLPVETLLERQPDYVLILAWNFAEEIMAQQSEYRSRGGRFILPIPVPRIVAA